LGSEPGPRHQVRGRREDGHVDTELGDELLGADPSDAGHRIQLGDLSRERRDLLVDPAGVGLGRDPVGCGYSDRAHELGGSLRPRRATVVSPLHPPRRRHGAATTCLPDVCRSIQLLAQLGRGDAAKDLEILSCLTSRPKTELDIEARGPTVLWGLDAAEGGCRWVMALRSGLVEQPGEQRQSPATSGSGPEPGRWIGLLGACSGAAIRNSASSGCWLLPELVDELPDLGLGVAAMPTQGLHERQLALFGPAGHRLGETDSSSATSAGSR
jgi:hypothetical protein